MTFGILDRGTTSEPGLSRPSLSIELGGGGGPGGIAGAALGAVAGAAGLSQGGAPLAERTRRLSIKRGVPPDVSWAEIVLAPDPGGGASPSVGDAGKIIVGPAAGAFACEVDMVERRADGTVRLTLTDGGRKLARGRMSQSFRDQSPGEIVASLGAEVGVDTRGGDGPPLPLYVVDGGASLLDHVARLAETAGSLAWFDDGGTLVLAVETGRGEAAARLAIGEDLIDAHMGHRTGSGGVAVDGAGVAERGGNAWAWLRKSAGPHRAEAGAAPPLRRMAAPWARSPATAQALAGARAAALEREGSPGRFLSVGASATAAAPGALVEVAGTEMDGLWRVRRQTITLDPDQGLLTEIAAVPAAPPPTPIFGLGGLF